MKAPSISTANWKIFVFKTFRKNWLEIVCCLAVILSFVYDNHVKFWVAKCFELNGFGTCMNVSAFEHILYEHSCILSETSILRACFGTKSLYFGQDLLTWSLHFEHNAFVLFEHSKIFILLYNLAHFGIPYISACNFGREWSSNQGQFLPIKNLDHGCKNKSTNLV